MLNNIRNFSKTLPAKILLIVIIVPFVFWGMGGVFNRGNTNNIVKINNYTISTQDFIDHLNTSNIDNIICNGNIGDPSSINKNLTKTFNIQLKDLLNMRTFLDHNRIYESPKELVHNEIDSSGAFCFKGKYISNHELINNLIEHFAKWKPYIKNYGLHSSI